jgi:hypothetical protein
LIGGCIVGLLFFAGIGLSMGGAGFDALYLCIACALSSTVIIVKVLYEKRELDTLPGRITLGVLVLQDIFAILFLAVIVQATGMARLVMLLRRWRDQPDVRPQGAAVLVTRLGLPLLCNLGWGLFALVGLSRLLGTPLSLIIYFAPDFGYILVVSGVVALVWSLVRTVVMLGLLRRQGLDRRATIAIPA